MNLIYSLTDAVTDPPEETTEDNHDHHPDGQIHYHGDDESTMFQEPATSEVIEILASSEAATVEHDHETTTAEVHGSELNYIT